MTSALHEMILRARDEYPLPLIMGFTCHGAVLAWKEGLLSPGSSLIFTSFLAYFCYTYPSSATSELVLQGKSPGSVFNTHVFLCFFSFVILLRTSRLFQRLVQVDFVFLIIQTFWLLDATRCSLVTLERNMERKTNDWTFFSCAGATVWSAAVWCCAPYLWRAVEKNVRGIKPPRFRELLPNSLDVIRFPLIMTFVAIIFYSFVLKYYLCPESNLSYKQCGDKHPLFYAWTVYTVVIVHLIRSLMTINENLSKNAPPIVVQAREIGDLEQ